MSGKSYQVLFQHFYSMLPKVSPRGCQGLQEIGTSLEPRAKKVTGHRGGLGFESVPC